MIYGFKDDKSRDDITDEMAKIDNICVESVSDSIPNMPVPGFIAFSSVDVNLENKNANMVNAELTLHITSTSAGWGSSGSFYVQYVYVSAEYDNGTVIPTNHIIADNILAREDKILGYRVNIPATMNGSSLTRITFVMHTNSYQGVTETVGFDYREMVNFL